MRVLDLFSGIGGISLGLERTGGFQTVAFCEIDPYCRALLAERWPGVPIFEDVKLLTAQSLSERLHESSRKEVMPSEVASDAVEPFPLIDIVVGGFP